MLGSALFVVLGRNIVRSGLAMMACFAALAGIYVLAGAIIVAATQVLVYIGAISILILFAIMLTQTKSGPTELIFHRQAWAGALAAIGFAFLFLMSVANTQWPLAGNERLVSSTRAIAMLLFQDSLYIFCAAGRGGALDGGGHRRRLPGQTRGLDRSGRARDGHPRATALADRRRGAAAAPTPVSASASATASASPPRRDA